MHHPCAHRHLLVQVYLLRGVVLGRIVEVLVRELQQGNLWGQSVKVSAHPIRQGSHVQQWQQRGKGGEGSRVH
jgi:hypothetical protein